MGSKSLGKKILVYLMTFMMVFSAMPASLWVSHAEDTAVDPRNKAQIGDHFEVSQENGSYSGTPDKKGDTWVSDVDGDDWNVRVNKTIAPNSKGTENLFDVTLTVQTKQKISTFAQPVDAAVVLVIDMSMSMLACMTCDGYTDKNYTGGVEDACTCTGDVTRRIDAAIAAAQEFIEMYSQAEGKGARDIAIVGFNSGGIIYDSTIYNTNTNSGVAVANVANGWHNAKTKGATLIENIEHLCKYDDGVSNMMGSGTNIHAGLLLARNLLEASDADYKSVVLLSDGLPRHYVSNDDSVNDFGKTSYILTTENENEHNNGQAQDNSNEITQDSQKAKTEPVSVAKYINETYDAEINTVYCGDSDNSTVQYLESFSTSVVPAYSTDALIKAFQEIEKKIEEDTQAWTASDPMGTNGQLTGVTSNTNTGEVVTTEDNLSWDLFSATPTESTETKTEVIDGTEVTTTTTIYTYSITYQVKLDTLADTFIDVDDAGNAIYYATNNPTKLDYYLVDENNVRTDGDIYFNIPSVKGYKGDYEFTKTDADGNALDGAKFTLTHDCQTCEACGPCDNCSNTEVTSEGECENKWERTVPSETEVVSDEKGVISFKDIPSGHTYLLQETTAPEGYVIDNKVHTLSVEYGEVYVDGVKYTEDANITIPNDKVTVKKVWDDNDNNNNKRPENVTLNLYAKYQDKTGKEYYIGADNELYVEEKVYNTKTLDVSNATNAEKNIWEYTFTGLNKYYYDAEGNEHKIIYSVKEATIPEGYYVEYDGLTVTNKLRVPAEAVIGGTKVLDGREWDGNDTFTFELYAANENYEVAETANAIDSTTVNNKEFSFEPLQYGEEGTYYYVIKEVLPEGAQNNVLNGVTYDTVSKHVKVEVANDSNGKLEATVKAIDSNGNVLEDGIVFTNNYAPTSTTATISGTKVLTGKELTEGAFSFRIAAVGEAPMPGNTEVTNDAKGNINFGSINYTAAGTYEYTITEVIPEDAEDNVKNGITYDGTIIKAKVTVTEDKRTGTLSASVAYSRESNVNSTSDKFVFTNRYEVDSVKVPFTATKQMDPAEGQEYGSIESKFNYKITPAASNPESDPIDEKTVTNDGNGAIVFANEAEYSEPGTYVYTVKELHDGQGGVVYDPAVYIITVVVEDNGAGKLVANVSITKSVNGGDSVVEKIEFTNYYDVKKTNVIIDGQKTLTGGHKTLEAGEFEFVLEAITENAPMPLDNVTHVVNDESGGFRFVFDEIVFPTTGVFKYKISEVNKGETGYEYDDIVYYATVTVTDTDEDGNKTGALSATVDYSTAESTSEDENLSMQFENQYIPEPISAVIRGTKALSGRDMTEGEVFTFNLIDSENNVVDSKTVTDIKDGKQAEFSFDEIEYTKAGTYTYTVVEESGSAGGVTYDNSVYNVTVNVTDLDNNNKHTGQLVATVTYDESIEFENTYEAESTSITISGTKTLTGRVMNAGEFEFKLIDTSPLLRNKEIETVKNAKDGTFVFEEIVYTKPGKYTYKVEEMKGKAGGVTYDNTVKEITVNVIDNGTGNLVASVIEDERVVEFNNEYSAEGSVELEISKELKGRDWRITDVFYFTLEPKTETQAKIENGDLSLPNNMETSISSFSSNYSATFGEIDFYKEGEYTFNIVENEGSDNNLIYDDKEYTVTVDVSDNLDGTLSADVTYSSEGETKDKAIFTNRYETTEATVKKVWADSEDQDGKRPESLTVTLSNGNTVTLNEENGWTVTVKDLPKYSDGEEIEYTWTEGDMPEGYALTDTSVDGTVTTLTNSYTPETTDLTVYKKWKDKNDKYGERPYGIIVYLQANGEDVQTIKITEDDNWRYTFTDLPVYEDGEKIIYSLYEEPVGGYITEIEDMTITNTIDPEEFDDNADTGDDSNPWAHGFVGLMAIIVAAGTLFFRRKTE